MHLQANLGEDYDEIKKQIGNIVEVQGRIAEIFKTTTGRQYVFISFSTQWKQPLFRIAIWNQVLMQMQERPSDQWIGRLVSISGLVDPVYNYSFKGKLYPRLSITLKDESKLRFINVRTPKTPKPSQPTMPTQEPKAYQTNGVPQKQQSATVLPTRSNQPSNADILKNLKHGNTRNDQNTTTTAAPRQTSPTNPPLVTSPPPASPSAPASSSQTPEKTHAGTGVVAAAVAGALVGGPVGCIVGGIAGYFIGRKIKK